MLYQLSYTRKTNVLYARLFFCARGRQDELSMLTVVPQNKNGIFWQLAYTLLTCISRNSPHQECYRLNVARLWKHVEDFQALRIERETCVAQKGCVAGKRSGIT